jgi:hypothetical protein
MNRTLGATLLLLLLPACSGGGAIGSSGPLPGAELRRKLLEFQASRYPARQYVIGLGSGATLEAATQAAFGEVTRQLTWLPAGSQDVLRGMYRVVRSATDADQQIQALTALERDGASTYLQKLSREAEQAARDRLPDCRRALEAGEIDQAEACLARGNADLVRASDLLVAARAAVGDAQIGPRAPLPTQVAYGDLARQSSAGKTGRRSLLLHVVKEHDGRAAGDLDETFAPAALESGFKRLAGELGSDVTGKALGGSPAALLKAARASGAGYALVGRVRAHFSSEEMGQYFAMASGVVKLIETVGGRSVVELSCQDVKGGHISREQALDKAVKEATRRLLEQLRPRLKELAGR